MTYISVALRQTVYARARGCCEYCLVPEALVLAPHEIDHIIAEKHGGKTAEENLALSCTICNKYKGSDIASVDPDSQEIVRLYHPRQDKWTDHFYIKTGTIVGQHSGQFFGGNGRMRVSALYYDGLANEKSRVSAVARKSVQTIGRANLDRQRYNSTTEVESARSHSGAPTSDDSRRDSNS